MKISKVDFRIVVSDFHLGTGHRRGVFNPFEDFFEDTKFKEFLNYHTEEYGKDKKIELILNGDVLDLLKVRVEKKTSPKEFPDEITEEISAYKVQQCLTGHPVFTSALSSFLDRGGTRITIIPGNHDIELLLPSSQKVFREIVAPGSLSKNLIFIDRSPTYSLPEGIQITHGHMFDELNHFNYKQLMIKRDNAPPILKLPWGSLMQLHVLIPAKIDRYYIDHIYPLKRLLLGGLIFDFRFAVKISAKLLYHFFKSRLGSAAGARVGRIWEGIKIILNQFSPMRGFDKTIERVLRKTVGVHTIIVGHSHQPRYRYISQDKLYVNTGTWIKMVNIDLQHLGQDSGLTYALITYDEDGTPRTTLRRWFGNHEKSIHVPY